MSKCLLLISTLLLMAFTTGNEPVPVSWRTLENIDFTETYMEEAKGYMLFPKFTNEVKKLNGKRVLVTGYTIPLEDDDKRVALSAYPYASCFFCGKAGPASVLTVKLVTAGKKYRIDQWRTFEGKLKLNATNIHEFYYILEEGTEVRQQLKKN